MDNELLTTFLPFINLAGFAINGFLFWKRGGSTATKEIIELQNNQIALLEKQTEALRVDIKTGGDRRHELGNKVQELIGEVYQLKGQVVEKDKKIDDLLSILQNRNPELDTFIKRITELAEGAATYMQQNQKNMEEIKQFMHSLNDRAGAVETRNAGIDSATSKAQGNLLRKKG